MITRRHILGWSAAATAGAAFPRLAFAASAPEAEALEAVFAAAGAPAMGGAVVDRTGVVWSGVRGLRRAGGAEAATAADLWHLGSNTKAMTAAAFARLVRQGRARRGLSLDEAFPDLTLDPAWRGTRLETLMHHRAGLLDAGLIDSGWLMAAHADARPLMAQRRALVEQALSRPPAGTPGAFVYGNANYIVAGAALEALTGRPWETVVAEEVFAPLDLGSAGFGPPRGDQPWGHRAVSGRRLPVDPSGFADNPPALGPAGTAHMTLADYGRFVGAMMGGAPDWLTTAELEVLIAPPPGPPPAYAAGWGVGRADWAGAHRPGPTLGHSGSNTMWFATVLAAPERGLGFIAVANAGDAGPACQQLIQRLVAVRTGA